MLGKLAVRNTKRNVKDYFIYLITITISFSLILAYNLVAGSDEVVKLSSSMGTFKNVLTFVNIIIIFVVCFLINYTTTIYSQDNGTNILLVIEDNGCGIKESDLSRVFEKGFTGSNRTKTNATGMGLYLSKKLCNRLGLKLNIASEEKEYTKLTLTFPKGTVHNFSN